MSESSSQPEEPGKKPEASAPPPAMSDAEERYRQLVELSPDILFIVSNHKIVFINTSGARLLGAQGPEQLVGRSVLDLVHPDLRETVRRNMSEFRSSRQRVPFVEGVLVRLDGTPLEVEVTAIPYEQGGVVGAQVIARDISVRKRTERERELLSRLALELTSAETLEKVADSVCNRTLERWGWDAFVFGVRRYGRARFQQVLAVDTVNGQKRRYPQDEYSVRLTEGLEPLIAGQPVLLNRADGEQIPGLIPFGDTSRLSASILYAPIRRGNDVVGMLSVQSYQPSFFGEEDRLELQRLADAIGPALARAQAEERSATFRRLGEQLGRASTPHEIARVLVEAADELIGWDSCWASVYSLEEDTLEMLVSYDVVEGKRRSRVPPPRHQNKPTEHTRQIMREGAQLILRETSENLRCCELDTFGEKSQRSMSLMFVPIRSVARLVGVLSIQSYTPQAYDEKSLQLLQELADHCAGALERARADAELRALFAAMNDVILVLDDQGRYLKIAPTNQSLLYRPASQLLGRTLHEVFSKELADRFLAMVHHALQEGQPITMEYALQIEGGERWFLATLSPMLENAILFVARDITDRKRHEQLFRTREARFRTFYHASPVMLCSTDLQGRIVAASDLWLENFGYKRPEVLGRYWTDFLDESCRRLFKEKLLPELEERGWCEETPVQGLKSSGQRFALSLQARMQREEKGNQAFVLIAFQAPGPGEASQSGTGDG